MNALCRLYEKDLEFSEKFESILTAAKLVGYKISSKNFIAGDMYTLSREKDIVVDLIMEQKPKIHRVRIATFGVDVSPKQEFFNEDEFDNSINKLMELL